MGMARELLGQQARMLNSLSPLPTIERGYGLVTDTEGKVVSSIDSLSPGESLVTYVADGSIHATVTELQTQKLSDQS